MIDMYRQQETPAFSTIGLNGGNNILFLFSPRRMSPQYKRPHLYDFNYNVMSSVENTIQDCLTQSINSHHKSFMFDKPVADAILPSAMGFHVDTSFIEQSWTFMLVVDNEKLPSTHHISQLLSSNPNRKLYTGVCSGEPINPIQILGNLTINPECVFYITHQTVVNTSSQHSANGTTITPYVMADVEVVQPMISSLTGTQTYKLDPYSVKNSIQPDFTSPNSNLIHINDVEASIPAGGEAFKYKTEWNSPKHHLQKLVSGTIETLQTASVTTGAQFNFNIGPDVLNDEFNSAIGGRLKINENAFLLDSVFSFSQLLSKYPTLKVEKIEIPNFIERDYADQSTISPVNKLSSLVSSVLTALLADSGLIEVAFRYTSYVPGTLSIMNNQDNFQLYNIATFCPVPDAIKMKGWNDLKINLQRTLFDMIRQTAGEFDLMCSCSCGSETHSVLNLLDFGVSNNTIFETANRLGGLNSPLVGNNDNLKSNAASLHMFTDTFVLNSTHI